MVATDERLLRIREVQEYLRLSRWTVLNWIGRGYLQAIVLPSGQYRIRSSEIERVLGEQPIARRAGSRVGRRSHEPSFIDVEGGHD